LEAEVEELRFDATGLAAGLDAAAVPVRFILAIFSKAKIIKYCRCCCMERLALLVFKRSERLK
jgi:hypothetical protein